MQRLILPMIVTNEGQGSIKNVTARQTVTVASLLLWTYMPDQGDGGGPTEYASEGEKGCGDSETSE